MKRCSICGKFIEKRKTYCSEECNKKRPPKEDMAGKVFGRYEIISYYGWHDGREYWNCECICGNVNKVSKRNLLNNRTQSCGCLVLEKMRDARFQDLSGQKFGRLTVVKQVPMPDRWSTNGGEYNDRRYRTAYLCKCDHDGVGEPSEITVEAEKLKTGKTKSCGCIREEKGEKHFCWSQIKTTCRNCGKEISKKQSQYNRFDNHFCCNKCNGQYYSGENSRAWKGGVSNHPYPKEWNNGHRSYIRERDNFACALCGKKQCEEKRALCVHHIDYDKNNLNEENLISLCTSCHSKTNANRKEWEKYFKAMMEKTYTA